ncbi:hypothetical protein PM10SUCC1_08270 [Propionigenium maris DSM 9537]|uniref:Uncharacterized protein n=1 Tax=Propionigenium maris DSM 9537 TaxID=1123000 RepID=A0A9W6GHG5_9FUSO|nr:hypothetical protein [Propionigenium maris]GLI55313.1 hypothetical protein PM10SUCC1_08270 [Propionigenium maris DSM 9537]
MKKSALLLGAFIVISATTLAWGGYGQGRGYGYGRGCGFWGRSSGGWHMGGRGYNASVRTPEDEKAYLEARERSVEIYNKYGVQIEQKQLEVERELLNEKPNWNKVEKLNEEIAKLEAKARTEMQRSNY